MPDELERYDLTFSYTDETGEEYTTTDILWVHEWGELQKIIKDLRADGCYNISATYIPSGED